MAAINRQVISFNMRGVEATVISFVIHHCPNFCLGSELLNRGSPMNLQSGAPWTDVCPPHAHNSRRNPTPPRQVPTQQQSKQRLRAAWFSAARPGNGGRPRAPHPWVSVCISTQRDSSQWTVDGRVRAARRGAAAGAAGTQARGSYRERCLATVLWGGAG